MELKITNKKDNSLLHRLEVEAELTASGPTPSNKDVAKEIASQLKVNEKLIVVKHIYSRFGTNVSDVLVYSYTDEDRMKEIEFIKETPQEEKPKEEAKPTEAPKEEKTEEKKE